MSQYQFEGPQTYNQFSLNFNKRDNPYSAWRGRVYGVINESDYRVKDRGFVPERLNLAYEKGDFALPFRVEVGDYYHYFSHRTIQRSLKGVQLEMQPDIGLNAGRRMSIQFASGAKQSTWKDFRLTEDLTKGTSLLFEDPMFGLWNLNFVHNIRKGIRSKGTLHRSQNVIGLAAEKTIPAGNQRITLEGEFDHFNGDHNGVSGPATGKGRDENALYFQSSGKSDLPLTYRLRFEDYGQDYRPNGAVVTPDRRSGEAHVGWRFDSGLRVRGRFQHYRDGVERADPVDTNTVGITFSGPLLKGIVNDLSGNINAYVQDVESRNKSSNTTTQTVTASFNKPIYAGWNGQADLFYQFINNQTRNSNDTTTRQVRISGEHALRFFGFKGNIRPGVMIRQIDNINSGTDDLYPTLAVNLSKGPHSFDYDMGFNVQNARLITNDDVKTLTQNFYYRYTMENNTFGLEINGADRNPDPGRVSKSFRASVFWTHQIGKKVRLRKLFRRTTTSVPNTYITTYPSSKGKVELIELAPSADMRTIKERLARANITGAYEQANLITYEVVLLNEIEQRQRLALEHKEGILQKASMIIEFDDVSDINDVMQTFERVRKELLDRYGNPTNFFEEGEFGANLINDINSGKFIRIMEWYRPDGIIRYGIPRRLDRQIRMEVQFARNFPPENDTLWSIERVR
ncbi:MAG: hypothetical protein SCARUB_01368 [Candidatus Scalindua rubra]|uniref:Uncharacterized protein n=1 Tax=Candidatus Scalindua rubra TaxID=1872076 RepID=A0A1E3XCX9_9BACT|nr:MAG: hypothetical protein SCARUB_01368 [Candidatus Scalindua rubra]